MSQSHNQSGGSCPFCGANLRPQARFCASCGRPLPATQRELLDAPDPAASGVVDPPQEIALRNTRSVMIRGDTLDLRELKDVVESSVRYWQESIDDSDALSREHAVASIEQLRTILQSLSQQMAQGRSTVRITTRLPAARTYPVICSTCGHGNRAGAKYCLFCRSPLSGAPRSAPRREKPMPLRLNAASRTDQGRVRHINQDSVYSGYVSLGDGGSAFVALVADGMGGHSAGEHASRIASEATQTQIATAVGAASPPDDTAWQTLLRNAARTANRRVYEEARANASQRGMGTTLTVALVVGERLHIASVGDSRAYLLNSHGVTDSGANSAQLTSDHSLVARLVDIGQLTAAEARNHPQRNVLYRTIGTDPAVEVDTRSEQLEPGDVILLCSDGLFNHVEDDEIARIALAQADPQRACDELVRLANERGGRDNISVVIVRVEGQKEHSE
jgi:protein phosphatase